MLLKIEVLLANYTQGIVLNLVGEFRALAGLFLVTKNHLLARDWML